MKLLKRFILVLIAIFLVFYALISVYIICYPIKTDFPGNKTLCVVFGAGITWSGEPSNALKFRLDKSIELYKNSRIKKIFISGKIAEIFVMKNYLIKNDIDTNDIITDYNGKNTLKTIENVRQYVKKQDVGDGIVFISQKYHIPRITLIAYKKKIGHSFFIAADTKNIDQQDRILFIARESLGFIKSLIMD